MDSELVPKLKSFRDLPLDKLKLTYLDLIPANLAPPDSFWASYNNVKLAIGLQACLAVWEASKKKIVPNEFQLKATIAMMSGQDSLIDAGTGSGKTLCMIIPCLLAPESTSVVISPLKRLQAVHVLEFERYGVKTVSINEDTPNDPELWKDIADGKFSALLVQPEQLSMIAGHMPRLARLIEKDRQFRKRIVHLHVDEAHFIYNAGLEHYGMPAFRPAWGRLGQFRIKLGKGLTVQALSGTQPPHIKKTIIEHLLFDEEKICSMKLSSNRPNMTYGMHPIVGDLSDFRNLNFLIPEPYPADLRLPKTLVFHDNLDECTAAALHVKNRLPKELRIKGIVKHYHGGMSKRYLTEVYEDFRNQEGACRILHATEGASTGLDIPDIEAVVQYGIGRDVSTVLQRGGRGGRNKSGQAVFLIMYEPWVMTIDLSAIDFHITDPDHPNIAKLTKFSTKQERTGIAMIRITQSHTKCLREMFADYLIDDSPDALNYTTPLCCDRHPGSEFHFHHLFKGRLLYQESETLDLYYGAVGEPDRIKILPPQKEKRKAQDKHRTPDERKSLISRLVAWRHAAHANDSLAAIRPASFIIDDTGITGLAKLHSQNITDYRQITVLLGQTTQWEEEWSREIFEVIRKFDEDLTILRHTTVTQKKTQQKRAKIALDIRSFEESTKENEERIRTQVLQRFAAAQQQGTSNSAKILRDSNAVNVLSSTKAGT